MTTTSLARRLLAGGAGLAIGVGGILMVANPAQATHSGVTHHEVQFLDVCDGVYVTILAESLDFMFTVTAGGDEVWPEEGDDGRIDGVAAVFVPKDAGDIEVTHQHVDMFPEDRWEHTWEDPGFCDVPAHTQPTCDTSGTVTIPAFPDLPIPDEVDEADFDLLTHLNDEGVEPESTHEVEPGSHTVSFAIQAHVTDTVTLEYVLASWTIEIEAPDCPDEPTDETLADTGSPTLWIAGVAVALLAIGGGLYFLTRRRGVDFTA